MIVVDTSAVVAILLGEASGPELAERLAQEPFGDRVMSAANYVEAGTVLAGRHARPERAIEILDTFLASASLRLVAVNEPLAKLALNARIRFGKGFGTRAKLNYGDSFAYALAKSLDAPLLFVGDDFMATDISSALGAR